MCPEAGDDPLRLLRGSSLAGVSTHPGDPGSVQPPAHGAKTHPVALGDEVVMDAPCGPSALPPQGVDLGHQDRIELAGTMVRPVGLVLKAGFALGSASSDPLATVG